MRGYDYSAVGLYFITICSHGKCTVFGNVVGGRMVLSKIGTIVEQELSKSMAVRDEIDVTDHVVMPNHVHAVIRIRNDASVAGRPGHDRSHWGHSWVGSRHRSRDGYEQKPKHNQPCGSAITTTASFDPRKSWTV